MAKWPKAINPDGGYAYAGDGYTQSIDMNRLAYQSRNQGKPVYILFTAPWCPSCRDFERDTLAQSDVCRALDNDVIYIKANLDQNKPLAKKLKVNGIPAGLLLTPAKDRVRIINRHDGGLTLAELEKFLNGMK